MNTGYVLFCNQASFGQCVSKRLYSCAGKHAEEAKKIPVGAVLFIFNTDAKTLIGPFTSASEGAERIETGAWNSTIDEHSASENVKLEWEDLHIIQNANVQFPFLANPEKCKLSALTTQTLLDALKEATPYKG
jgi:hypothetical protein